MKKLIFLSKIILIQIILLISNLKNLIQNQLAAKELLLQNIISLQKNGYLPLKD